jgi:hypothetical protein
MSRQERVQALESSRRVSDLGDNLLGIPDETFTHCAACNPGDIDAQMTMLQKYRRSRFDIVGRVGDELALRILGLLDAPEVLSLPLVSDITNLGEMHRLVNDYCDRAAHAQVSREHARLSRKPELWKGLCLELDRGQGDHGGSVK